MAARAGQRAGRYRVVARGAQQVKTVNFQPLAVAQDVNHLAGARFLRAAQRFILKRSDTARLVARRRILVNRLVMGDKVLLEIIDHRHQLAEGLFVATVAHQQLLGAEHFRHFGQDGGAAVGNQIIREAAQHRVSGNAGQTVRTAALETKLQFAQLTRLALVMAHHVI